MAIEDEDPRFKALKAFGYNPYVLYEVLGILDEIEGKPGVDVFRYSLGDARLARNSAKRLNSQAKYHRNRNGYDDQLRAALYRVGAEACRRLAATLEAMDEATSVAAETRVEIVLSMRDRARATLETYLKRLFVRTPLPKSLMSDEHVDAMAAALIFADGVGVVGNRGDVIDAMVAAYSVAGPGLLARMSAAFDAALFQLGLPAEPEPPQPEEPTSE